MNLWNYAKMKGKQMKIKLIAVTMAVIMTLVLFISISQSQDLDCHTISTGPEGISIKGRISVYFEICGSGFSIEEKKTIEQEISEAIKKILDDHFE